MTNTQLTYWRDRESRRNNLATEYEAQRANLARENETARHNKAVEEFNQRQLSENLAQNLLISNLKLAEDKRQFDISQAETHRSNEAKEKIQSQANLISAYSAAEQMRANKAREETNLMIAAETQRSNMAREQEQVRRNTFDIKLGYANLEENKRVNTNKISTNNASVATQMSQAMTASERNSITDSYNTGLLKSQRRGQSLNALTSLAQIGGQIISSGMRNLGGFVK